MTTIDLTKAKATGAAISITMQYSKPVLDRARYTLSRGEATPDEQRAASALLESIIGVFHDHD